MTFDLPSENVFIILRRAFRSDRPKEFTFPVAFSKDLRQISVLGCVIRLIPPHSSSQNDAYTFHSQNMIEASAATGGTSNSEMSFFSQDIKYADHTNDDSTWEDWYRTEFSPNCSYLLAIRGHMAPGSYKSFYKEWQLTIHQDESQPHEQPNFQYLAQHSTKAVGSIDGSFIFHPFEPVLAISRLGNVILWFFAAQRG